MRIFDESLRQLLELKRFEQRKINIETDLTQSQKKTKLKIDHKKLRNKMEKYKISRR